MTTIANATTYYANVFKHWPKLAGEKPSTALLDTVHKLGARPGKQALANAMYLREGGATNSQVILACGAPQLNKMRELCTKGHMKRIAAPATETGHTVYRIALTPKGETKVKNWVAPAEGETPAKGKKAKAGKTAKAPRKAKGATEAAPAAETPAMTAPAPETAGEQAPAN